jgi:excinuclease ABC subunit B
LTQTAGRAARNVNGRVIFYADTVTESMQLTIDETNRRREKQLAYNEKYGITPTQIVKNTTSLLGETKPKFAEEHVYTEQEALKVADPIVEYMSKSQLEKAIERTRKLMEEAAKKLEFIEAAQYRDEMIYLQKMVGDRR